MAYGNNISGCRHGFRTGLARCRQPMNSRLDYDLALTIVGTAIRDWDPVELAADGSPLDEYAQEATRVVARIPRCRSEVELAAAISDVFSESFGADTFAIANCSEPSRRIYTGLVGAGLLQPA